MKTKKIRAENQTSMKSSCIRRWFHQFDWFISPNFWGDFCSSKLLRSFSRFTVHYPIFMVCCSIHWYEYRCLLLFMKGSCFYQSVSMKMCGAIMIIFIQSPGWNEQQSMFYRTVASQIDQSWICDGEHNKFSSFLVRRREREKTTVSTQTPEYCTNSIYAYGVHSNANGTKPY